MKKELVKTDKWVDRVNEMRRAAMEADSLKSRHYPKDGLFLSGYKNNEELFTVELTRSEWAAIRSFLRNKRITKLREAGVYGDTP